MLVLWTLLLFTSMASVANAADPLPSWNDTATKAAIIDFVERITTDGSPDYVPVQHRIATFDNDGTLWVEQPMYAQLAFALDRIMALAPQHPDWQTQEPFKSILAGDLKTAMAGGEKSVVEIVMASHAGMTTDDFSAVVADWLANARHPRFDRPYTDMVYRPMLELLAYLRREGFTTYIVSGGGVEFMRVFSERVYGVPVNQVVGSSIKTKFEMQDGVPVLRRLAEVDFIDDKDVKPIGSYKCIGQRPIAAFGNSDGDLQMLQWATAGDGARLGLIVHHTDAGREYAYDRESHVGKLDVALDQAAEHGWVVVDMKNDWRTIFPALE